MSPCEDCVRGQGPCVPVCVLRGAHVPVVRTMCPDRIPVCLCVCLGEPVSPCEDCVPGWGPHVPVCVLEVSPSECR